MAAGTAEGAAPAPCGPWAVAAGLGKNVAGRPLWTCHLSHSKMLERAKTTHRMVRRMSFMELVRLGKRTLAGGVKQPAAK